MATLACEQFAAGGIALIGVHLTTAVQERVTIEPMHDPPVWPPRSQGVPESGWDDGTWTGIVRPGSDRALGYATPADVDDPPVRITAAVSADETATETVSTRDVVRALGAHKPTRDAVPVPEDPVEDSAADEEEGELPDLEGIENRLDRAEALADAGSADAIDAAGGRAAVRTLAERLAADRSELEDLRRRTERLAERAKRLDGSVSALASSK